MAKVEGVKKNIENDKEIPEYIKELMLEVVKRIDSSAVVLAKQTAGNIVLSYYRARMGEKEEIERLRKAFKKYGRHIDIVEDGSFKGSCERLRHSKNACNCGFEQALKGE